MASYLTNLYNHPWINPFLALSYPVPRPEHPDAFPNSNYYNAGLLDIGFIISWIAVLAVLREIFRLGILEPFAKWWLRVPSPKQLKQLQKTPKNGIPNGSNGHHAGNGAPITRRRLNKEERLRERNAIRFSEQGWVCIYYTVYWGFGMWLHFNLPTAPFQLDRLWVGYPHYPLPGPVKFYYLSQLASWLHQVLVLNAEAHRKDHYQMMAHHFVTIGLMSLSYYKNFTRIGCLILVLMDWCDIILALAKMLRYLELKTLCDCAFVSFIVSWFLTRHALFICVIKSAYSDSIRLLNGGMGTPEETLISWRIFMSLLISLQIILCVWSITISQAALKVVMGSAPEDPRSDEEDGVESEHTDNEKKRSSVPSETRKDR